MSNNILLITFPVDLGNRTLEENQQSIFKADMDFYRFAEQHAAQIDKVKISKAKSLMYRIKSAIALRRIVARYTCEGKVILFNGVSPALFAFGTWRPDQTAIVLDWTRTLYDRYQGRSIKRDWVFYLHRAILRRCPKFLCWTDAIIENLHEVYGIKKKHLHKVPAPFLVEKLNIAPRPTPEMARVLFVGGDLKRKGGDVLLEGWSKYLKGKCLLTMMTNDPRANIDGVNFLPGVKYGSELHRKTFEEHDILILPTRIDAYPQVIGEAAAAGLAVVTTKFALGAKEIIRHGEHGLIAETPEDTIPLLLELLENRSSIDLFKVQAYHFMHQNFAREKVREGYIKLLVR